MLFQSKDTHHAPIRQNRRHRFCPGFPCPGIHSLHIMKGLTMRQYTIEQFKSDLSSPYAWPGGYPRYFITSDGAALSYKSAMHNQKLIFDAIKDQSNDGWQVVGCEINWEDSGLYCDDTSERIKSAYAEE